MGDARDPSDRALDPEAETCMRDGSEAAQIQIPFESLFRKIVLFNPGLNLLQIIFALSAADNFAVTFRRNHIHASRELRIFFVLLHVESFNREWIVMNHHRTIELL